jgi:GNAT superfamily N-acetyltransferase
LKHYLRKRDRQFAHPTIFQRPFERRLRRLKSQRHLPSHDLVEKPFDEGLVKELPAMLEAANYSAFETLRDGRRVEIRALRPDDRADLIAAVARSSAQSLYRRFFAVKRDFSEPEIEFFLNVDFVDHVALVAVVDESGRSVIAGGARYVVVQPGKAEVAFAVVDQYQGQGLGAALMHHLAAIGRGAGLEELIAEVLPDNVPMLKVFEKSGLPLSMKREPQVVHVALRLR